MKALVTGSNGQLGWEVCRQGKERGYGILPAYSADMDITKKISLSSKIPSIDFDILINCAAYTAVDRAETEQEQAYAANSDGLFFS